ncbi:MAG: hypothetical protein R3C05_14630 [Pirellulaceae bacterium]
MGRRTAHAASLTGATLSTNITDAPGVTAAYVFDGTGGGQFPSYFSALPAGANTQTAAWEVLFRPSDTLGNEIVFETGAGSHGVSLNIKQETGGYRVQLAVARTFVNRQFCCNPTSFQTRRSLFMRLEFGIA